MEPTWVFGARGLRDRSIVCGGDKQRPPCFGPQREGRRGDGADERHRRCFVDWSHCLAETSNALPLRTAAGRGGGVGRRQATPSLLRARTMVWRRQATPSLLR